MKTYDDSRANFIARLFLCRKQHSIARNDNNTTFLVDVTIRILLRFFAFRLCRCSTVKSRSKREKLSLKTLIIPRGRLAIELGSFFIYATILSLFVDFVDCDFNSHLRLLFSVLLRLCRKVNKKTEVNPNEKSSLFHKKSQRQL